MDRTRRGLLRAVSIGIGAGLAGCNAIGDNEGTQNTTKKRTSAATPVRSNATGTHEPTTATTPTTGTHGSKTEAREPSTPTGTRLTTRESDTGATGASQRATHTVGMYTGLYFDPVGLYIDPGETVSFEDVSGAHSATAFHPDIETYSIDPKRRVPKSVPPWNTGIIYEVGKSKRITLETKGTYDYFCIPHVEVGMVGRIVVGEPGGPATKTQNPYANYYPLPDSERIVDEKTVSFDAVAPE